MLGSTYRQTTSQHYGYSVLGLLLLASPSRVVGATPYSPVVSLVSQIRLARPLSTTLLVVWMCGWEHHEESTSSTSALSKRTTSKFLEDLARRARDHALTTHLDKVEAHLVHHGVWVGRCVESGHVRGCVVEG